MKYFYLNFYFMFILDETLGLGESKLIWSNPKISILPLNNTFGGCVDSVAKPNPNSSDGAESTCS